MAQLYGEGPDAFQRFQPEILASSDDESLFAWTRKHLTHRTMSTGGPNGMLADSPLHFSDSGDIVRSSIDEDQPPFSMTNKRTTH